MKMLTSRDIFYALAGGAILILTVILLGLWSKDTRDLLELKAAFTAVWSALLIPLQIFSRHAKRQSFPIWSVLALNSAWVTGYFTVSVWRSDTTLIKSLISAMIVFGIYFAFSLRFQKSTSPTRPQE